MAKSIPGTKPTKPSRPRALKGAKGVAVDAATAVESAVAQAQVLSPTSPAAAPDTAQVRARAFELWTAAGGTALDNWLMAERELTSS